MIRISSICNLLAKRSIIFVLSVTLFFSLGFYDVVKLPGIGLISVYAAAEYSSGYFHYVVEDESVSITGYFGKEESVTIPSSIANLPVSKVCSGAFAASKSVKSVELPDTIMEIEQGAFGEGQSLIYPEALTGQVGSAASGQSFEDDTMDKPWNESGDQTKDRPGEQSAEQSSNQIGNQPAGQSGNQPSDQIKDQPGDQTIDRSRDQTRDESDPAGNNESSEGYTSGNNGSTDGNFASSSENSETSSTPRRVLETYNGKTILSVDDSTTISGTQAGVDEREDDIGQTTGDERKDDIGQTTGDERKDVNEQASGDKREDNTGNTVNTKTGLSATTSSSPSSGTQQTPPTSENKVSPPSSEVPESALPEETAETSTNQISSDSMETEDTEDTAETETTYQSIKSINNNRSDNSSSLPKILPWIIAAIAVLVTGTIKKR